MAKKMNRLFITIKDLQIITGTGYKNCIKKMNHLKDAMGKQKHQHITFNEYAKYEGINVEEIYTTINT